MKRFLSILVMLAAATGCAQTVGSGSTIGAGSQIGLPASDLPTPPSTAFTYSHLQIPSGNPGTWFLCQGTACAGGTNTGNCTAGSNITSPSFTGFAMSTNVTGPGYNCLQYRHLYCAVFPSGGTATVGTLTINVPTPTYTTSSITINASATDTTNTVTAIQIYLDNVLIFNSAVTGPITPISYTITGLEFSHTIVTQAFNNVGAVAKVTSNITFGPDCSTVANILLDERFYVPTSTDLTHVQAFEFDPDLFNSLHQFFPSLQCRLQGTNPGLWYFWNMLTVNWEVTNSGGGTIPTYPCTSATVAKGVWHHLQLYAQFNQTTNQYIYQTFVYDGVTVFHNINNPYPAGNLASSPFMNVENQIDLDSTATTATAIYDDMSVTYW